MDILYWKYLMVVGIGVIAGFINVVAAGGSLLTLPLLIFTGLPSTMANGTNRVGIVIQNVVAIYGFHKKGYSSFKFSGLLSITAVIGALLGVWMAHSVSDEQFKKILAVVMVVIILFTFFKPSGTHHEKQEKMDKKHQLKSALIFLGVGFYGGFIQAGVGAFIMMTLSLVNHISLVKANSIKVFVILVFNLVALGIFSYYGNVDWSLGLCLALGTSVGGWIASQWSVSKGDVWIRRVLLVSMIMMSIKLWFLS